MVIVFAFSPENRGGHCATVMIVNPIPAGGGGQFDPPL